LTSSSQQHPLKCILSLQLLIVIFTVIAPCCFSQTSPTGPVPHPADLVFRNAEIYTVDAARTWVEAIAIDEGKIVYAGTNEGVLPWIGQATEVISLQGRMVLPGFHDAHVHLISGGIEMGECNLIGLNTQKTLLDTVRTYAMANPDEEWISGGGWELPIFPGGNPHKSLLDAVVPDRPVFLTSSDAHTAWVNSAALKIAGITRHTPDPPNGRIERDPKTGEPTGTLREEAMNLITAQMPPYSDEDYLEGLRRGLEMTNRFGITSVQEANASQKMLEAYHTLDQKGELTVRVLASMKTNLSAGKAQIPQLVAWRNLYESPHLRTSAVKIFADGVIEARTAAMLEPYLDLPDNRGFLNLKSDSLQKLIVALDSAKFQVHVHAIGDRAIRTTLDAFAAAQQQNGIRDSRHHMAHIQMIDSLDVLRFRPLGVIANFQPLWAYADTYITELTEPALGQERSRWLYPINSVKETGAMVVFGSDWSVTSMNPLHGMQVGVTRLSLEDSTGTAWIPQERVDLATMIAGYTINGAYLNFEEKETGSIEVGKAADLVVLDRNLFEIPPQDIHGVRVMLTLLEGKVVYKAENW
jgi:predicted amidohydrolase YtcJ